MFDVTQTTIKRWANDGALRCTKTPGGHRKYVIRDVLAFSEQYGMRPLGAMDTFGENPEGALLQSAVLSHDDRLLAGMLVPRLLEPDGNTVNDFLLYLFQHHILLPEICDHVLFPAMQTIGERWSAGEIDVTDEHAASHRLLDAIQLLQGQIAVKPAAGMRVACASLDDELHDIGLRCVAGIFASEGWQVTYLGARTPVDSLLRTIRNSPPRALCISSTAPRDPAALLAALRELRETMERAGGTLLIGGPAFRDAAFGAEFQTPVMRTALDVSRWIHRTRLESRVRGNGTEGT